MSCSLPRHLPFSNSLEEANEWAEHTLERAVTYLRSLDRDIALESLGETCKRLTMSSCFSGTGGSELSAMGFARCLEYLTCKTDIQPECLWACDVDAECRFELMLLPHQPKCIFNDVNACLRKDVYNQLVRSAADMRYSELQKIFRHPNLVVDKMPVGACVLHPGCSCVARRADLHVAGTECPAWSSQGKRDGCSGKRVMAWGAWIADRRKKQESVVYHENVSGFPLQLLRDELSDMYVVSDSMSCLVCPSRFGQAYERVRRLTILWHKRWVSVGARESCLLGSSFQDFCTMAERTCTFDWKSYFWISGKEVNDELQWSLRRPRLAKDVQKSSRNRPDRTSFDITDHDKSLNDFEAENIQHYLSMHRDSVCSVGQNAFTHPQWNHGRPTLHTIIKKGDLFYSRHFGRWLTPSELLQVHNYPMKAGTSFFGLRSSFDFARSSMGLPERRRNSMISQVGNGMALSTQVLGFAFITALMAHANPPPLIARSSLVDAVLSAAIPGQASKKQRRNEPATSSDMSHGSSSPQQGGGRGASVPEDLVQCVQYRTVASNVEFLKSLIG